MRAPAAPVRPEDLALDPHPYLHRLRADMPVAWLDSLETWLVTDHRLCSEVMLDPVTYTVDDPRFSTQQVIGPSMLSLDGTEHRRHREPFSQPFRAAEIKALEARTRDTANELMTRAAASGTADLRSRVAGPLAVEIMTGVLDLGGVSAEEVLAWYQDIVDAVHAVTQGGDVPASGVIAFESLKSAVAGSLSSSSLLQPVDQAGSLEVDEIVSNVAVLLFGGIVTAESGTAIALRTLLLDDDLTSRLDENRALVAPFVDEVFRLEPSAAVVDRYATRDVTLAGAEIRDGDLVRVSLSAANRDPAVFPDPDSLDLSRENLGKSLTFARGPHACLGIHLARLETRAAVEALLDQPGAVEPDPVPVTGLVFRAPETVQATWSDGGQSHN